MKNILYSVITLIFLNLILLTSCDKKTEKYTEYSFDYFDTVTTVTGYEKDKEEFDKVIEFIFTELNEYHKLYNIYNRYEGMENLCTVNELKDGEHRAVTVDKKIIDMLLYAKEMYNITKENTNIALGSVLSIWHDYRERGISEPYNATIPPLATLQGANLYADINNVIIDKENYTVFLTHPKTRLDVGAVAKGYAVEMVAQGLEEMGVGGYVLNVGGNVRTVGLKPNGEKWLVGIENPIEDSDEPYAAYLYLESESLVTSGSYQRFYIVDGKSYHHIIDKDTLMPAEGYLSVSVICKSSADGDTLSTALFCMDLEEGKLLVESLPETEAMWILEDGTKVFSSGFSKYTEK